MRPISKLETEQRIIEFPPGFGGPIVWTGLAADGLQISNCLEGAEWNSDPVFPFVCEECFTSACAAYGLARVRRTATQLVWLPPVAIDRAWPPEEELKRRAISEALLIDTAEWDRIARRVTELPPSETFPKILEGDLYRLWLQQRPPWAVERYEDTFAGHLRRYCIASHPLELEDAIDVIEEFGERMWGSEREFEGRLERIDPDPDLFQTLYFDGRGTPEFVAFSVQRPHQLVIAGEYVAR